MAGIFFRFLFICLFLLFLCDVVLAQVDHQCQEISVTLNAKNASISSVVDYIKSKYGWSIQASEQVQKIEFSGNFLNEPMSTFFKKILKERNVAILYDCKKKNIEMVVYNTSNFEKKLHLPRLNSQGYDTDESQETFLASSLIDEQLSYLDEVRKNEQMLYEEWVNNPSSYDPISKMTLGEMDSIRRYEQVAYEQLTNNSSVYDPVTEVTQDYLIEIKKNENIKYEQWKNDMEAKDPVTGISLKELEFIKTQEKILYEKKINDNN